MGVYFTNIVHRPTKNSAQPISICIYGDTFGMVKIQDGIIENEVSSDE